MAYEDLLQAFFSTYLPSKSRITQMSTLIHIPPVQKFTFFFALQAKKIENDFLGITKMCQTPFYHSQGSTILQPTGAFEKLSCQTNGPCSDVTFGVHWTSGGGTKMSSQQENHLKLLFLCVCVTSPEISVFWETQRTLTKI